MSEAGVCRKSHRNLTGNLSENLSENHSGKLSGNHSGKLSAFSIPAVWDTGESEVPKGFTDFEEPEDSKASGDFAAPGLGAPGAFRPLRILWWGLQMP